MIVLFLCLTYFTQYPTYEFWEDKFSPVLIPENLPMGPDTMEVC